MKNATNQKNIASGFQLFALTVKRDQDHCKKTAHSSLSGGWSQLVAYICQYLLQNVFAVLV